MEMGIEPERVSETLHKTDSSTTGPPVGCSNAGAAADRGEDGAHENLQNISHQGRIIGQAVAKAIGGNWGRSPLLTWLISVHPVWPCEKKRGASFFPRSAIPILSPLKALRFLAWNHS